MEFAILTSVHSESDFITIFLKFGLVFALFNKMYVVTEMIILRPPIVLQPKSRSNV